MMENPVQVIYIGYSIEWSSCETSHMAGQEMSYSEPYEFSSHPHILFL
jgi:hypothetical protein